MGNGQIVPVAIGVALKCLGSAPACYMILAMLADVIDHIEYKSGIRTDGLDNVYLQFHHGSCDSGM